MKPKLPHVIDIIVSLLTVLVAWATKEIGNGDITVPAWLVTVLSLISLGCSILGPSALPGVNAKAVAVKVAGASLLVLVLGSLIFVGRPQVAHRTVLAVPQESGQVAYLEQAVGQSTAPCPIVAQGCGWWNSGGSKNVVTDLGQIAQCVISNFFSMASPSVAAITAACVGATVTDVEEILASLIEFYTNPPDAGAPGTPTFAIWHSSRVNADIVIRPPTVQDRAATVVHLRATSK